MSTKNDPQKPAEKQSRKQSKKSQEARERILGAAMNVFRQKGYAATRVEDVCAAAGMTKGGFFHHFSSKEQLAEETARFWSAMTGGFFAGAPYHLPDDPLERVLAYIAFRKEIIQGDIAEFTCVAGTLVQEVYGTYDPIREAAHDAIFDHAQTLVADISAAKEKYAPNADFDPQKLAAYTQAVLQGAFILAKAKGDAEIARDMVDVLSAHMAMQFNQASGQSNRQEKKP